MNYCLKARKLFCDSQIPICDEHLIIHTEPSTSMPSSNLNASVFFFENEFEFVWKDDVCLVLIVINNDFFFN